jgi:hypothetical protein
MPWPVHVMASLCWQEIPAYPALHVAQLLPPQPGAQMQEPLFCAVPCFEQVTALLYSQAGPA